MLDDLEKACFFESPAGPTHFFKMIYEPAEDSYFLQEYVRGYAQGRVLDMGTGSGIQAETAAENPHVKEVIAVDINEEAIEKLNEKNIRKITALQSDLFENVHGNFNAIFFNPPYLPQDKREDVESQLATTGGKHGWEILERFFQQVGKFMFHGCEIYLLFSSLTNKEKVNQIITQNMFQFEEVDQEKLHMETLFIYKITKTAVLKAIQDRGVEDLTYFTHGRRGNIFTGKINRNIFTKSHIDTSQQYTTVGIKVERSESAAQNRMENEASWLEELNKKHIGPKLLFSGPQYIIYEFVEGQHVMEWLASATKDQILSVLEAVLTQCRTLDEMGVQKEEMHRPHKHIIIDKWDIPTLIDFERCHRTEKPHNVTQFVEFICRSQQLQEKLTFSVDQLRSLAQEYAHNREYFDQILKELIKF